MTGATAELYVIGFPDGPVKVGWSADVPARLQSVKRQRADATVAVIATVPVPARYAIEAERYAHWLLRGYHFRHEWFNVSADHAATAIEAAAGRDYSLIGRIPPVEPRGRAAPFPESFIARFPRDTFGRIGALGETRMEFVRSATLAELDKREAMATRSTGSKRATKPARRRSGNDRPKGIGAHRFACALTCKPESD
ncbi:MAG: GIY-YIG nuclease family protein [Rhizobiaceae bacterium]|nr:GIY-YIG nuclease family protein [Rhizobiaceae bacterium]